MSSVLFGKEGSVGKFKVAEEAGMKATVSIRQGAAGAGETAQQLKYSLCKCEAQLGGYGGPTSSHRRQRQWIPAASSLAKATEMESLGFSEKPHYIRFTAMGEDSQCPHLHTYRLVHTHKQKQDREP